MEYIYLHYCSKDKVQYCQKISINVILDCDDPLLRPTFSRNGTLVAKYGMALRSMSEARCTINFKIIPCTTTIAYASSQRFLCSELHSDDQDEFGGRTTTESQLQIDARTEHTVLRRHDVDSAKWRVHLRMDLAGSTVMG